MSSAACRTGISYLEGASLGFKKASPFMGGYFLLLMG